MIEALDLPVFAVHECDVAVDPDTGHVEVLDYRVVQDVGRAINPRAIHGQIQGGVVQGLGYALHEELTLGADGRLAQAGFETYRLPLAGDSVPVRIDLHEGAPSIGPLGAKGAGEVPILNVGAAVACAVADAIDRPVHRLPLTPVRVLGLLVGAEEDVSLRAPRAVVARQRPGRSGCADRRGLGLTSCCIRIGGMAQSEKSPSELIDERIEELGDWRGETLARLRALIKEAEPDVVEEWKWRGVPTWYHEGMLCTGESYKAAVKVTFAKGASLEDPSGLFNSSLEGNVRRAIDFHEGDAIDEKAFKALVREAVDLNGSKAKR